MAQSDSAAAPQREETPPANTYKLHCNDCSFESTVEGDCHDELEVADAHQEEYGETLTDHFVNFRMER